MWRILGRVCQVKADTDELGRTKSQPSMPFFDEKFYNLLGSGGLSIIKQPFSKHYFKKDTDHASEVDMQSSCLPIRLALVVLAVV
jgi:hypothetical protein